MKFSNRVLTVALLAIVSTSLPAAAVVQEKQKPADDQEPVKLSATLVEVPAIITDRSGRFITDLTQKDFKVSEDGKRQEVATFAAVKQPFNAVLVLDTSNSAQDRLRAIQNTAVSFTKQLGKDDRMMVISFDNEVRQLTDFTGDAAELEKAIKGTESGFGKLLYEAVTKGLEQLKDVKGRRAIILFSDGIDMKSIDATAESTTRLADEIGAVIYFIRFDTRWWAEAEARRQESEKSKSKLPFDIDGRIPLPPDFGGPDPNNPEIPNPSRPRIEVDAGGIGIGTPRRTPPITRGGDAGSRVERFPTQEPTDPVTENLDKLYGDADAVMLALTGSTGGRVFDAATFETTRNAFAMIADELRNLYVLGYYPAGKARDNKYHKIKVEVIRKDVQVRARQGYRAKAE